MYLIKWFALTGLKVHYLSIVTNGALAEHTYQFEAFCSHYIYEGDCSEVHHQAVDVDFGDCDIYRQCSRPVYKHLHIFLSYNLHFLWYTYHLLLILIPLIDHTQLFHWHQAIL